MVAVILSGLALVGVKLAAEGVILPEIMIPPVVGDGGGDSLILVPGVELEDELQAVTAIASRG